MAERAQIRIDEETQEELKALQRCLGVQRASAVVSLAIGLLSWAADAKLSDMEIAKYDPKDGTQYLLSQPQLDKLNRNRPIHRVNRDEEGSRRPTSAGSKAGKASKRSTS